MGTDSTSRTLVSLVLVGLAAWVLWLVRDVLPPFLMAMGLSLLLDPVLERLVRRGVPRWAAVALTFGAFLGIFIGVVAIIVPIATGQVTELVGNFGTYGARMEQAADALLRSNSELLQKLNLPPTLPELLKKHQGQISGYLQMVLGRVLETVQSSLGALGWVVVVPIVTLYLLADLDRIKARGLYLISAQHRETVVNLATQVGGVFAAYIRGLTFICAAFGVVVFLALEFGFEMRYALILGIAASILYAIPYLGQMALLVACVAVAWSTGRHTSHTIGVGITIVVIGQVFDQLVSPRVVGRQVGLHPVLGLFALMVGGQFFGLMGMILAVPVAASIRVVLLHLFPRLGHPLPGFERKPRLLERKRKVEGSRAGLVPPSAMGPVPAPAVNPLGTEQASVAPE